MRGGCRSLRACPWGFSPRGAPSRRATPCPQAQTQAPGGGRPLSQDRIASDGSWWSGGGAPARSAASEAQPYVIGSATAPGPTAPATAPASDAAIDRLADLLQRARGSTLILTGAGCSTESGVPDYRGPAGAYTTSNFKPMSHQQFMASPANRERYWARSFAGWPRFSTVQPNAAHDSIARLQHRGWARALITQNVDRLHAKAGSKQVLELHGTTHEVVCMGCSRLLPRHDFQQTLADLNPAAAAAVAALGAREDAADERERLLRAGSAAAVGPSLREVSDNSGSSAGGPVRQHPEGDAQVLRRPDGDVELTTEAAFQVPACTACGGLLKPHVVFFGDGIPAGRAQQALDLALGCRNVLVVGSSLAVWSAYRLVKAAVESGASLALLTAGPTRADELATMKLEARAGETLARLAAHPSLQVPPMY